MLNLSTRDRILLASGLFLLMAVTRGHHSFTLAHLPDASWAVFFLAGLYLRPLWLFTGLFAFAAILDYVAITWGGVSSFCVTSAYLFLLPAYGSLWLSGRIFARLHRPDWLNLALLPLSALAGTLSCELLSSGGFYFFSGRFVEPSLSEFAGRFMKYLPDNLQAVALYLGLAAGLHGLFFLKRLAQTKPSSMKDAG